MLELTRNTPLNKGRIRRTIIDHPGKTVSIEYEVGYMEGETYRDCGVDCLHLSNQPAETDEDGKVTKPAVSDFDDAMKVFATSKTPDAFAIDRLKAKAIIKATKEEER